MSSNTKKSRYTGNKLKVALALASGEKTQRETAAELGMDETTISKWKKDPEYLAYVDDLTLKHENASKAGLLRSVLVGMKIKEDSIDVDKSTHLDYVKAAADLQGHNKGDTHNMNVNVGVSIVDDVPKPQMKQIGDDTLICTRGV